MVAATTLSIDEFIRVDYGERREPCRLAPRSLELFSGAGGLALATHAAGFRHEALIEWNNHAAQTLRTNVALGSVEGIRSWKVLQEDVRKIRFGQFGHVDVLAGGAPCQPFSIGGKHRGMDDHRNMIPEYIRAVHELAPRAFILENVKGLLRPGFREYFSYVVFALSCPDVARAPDETWADHRQRLMSRPSSDCHSGLRYDVAWKVLNAADYGVPQSRERVFVVGFRADTGVHWRFPETTHSERSLFYDKWVTGAYWDRHHLAVPDERPEGHVVPLMERQGAELFPKAPWRTVRDALAGLPDPRPDGDAPGVFNHRLIPGARQYTGHTGSSLDLPSKTLKAGDHGVPGGENTIVLHDGTVRYVTVREAARLQTFPDSWRIEGTWSEAMRQLGNAVPVDLGAAIACHVAQRLTEAHDRGV